MSTHDLFQKGPIEPPSATANQEGAPNIFDVFSTIRLAADAIEAARPHEARNIAETLRRLGNYDENLILAFEDLLKPNPTEEAIEFAKAISRSHLDITEIV